VLIDRRTGEMIEVDDRGRRLARMKRRASRWGDVVKPSLESGQAELLRVGLTYRPGAEWRPYQISEYVRSVRRLLRDRLYGVFWVAELQERGAVHYHALLWVAKGARVPMPDKSGAWIHGSSKVERAIRGVGYLMKYQQKEAQKEGDFPKGLRLYAGVIYKWAPLTVSARKWFGLSAVPRWAEDGAGGVVLFSDEKIRRREGGGYQCGGLVLLSPWTVRLSCD
jgi:hypothetical protein